MRRTLARRPRRDLPLPAGSIVVDFAWGNDIDAQHRSAVTERTYRFDGEEFVFVSERERREPQSSGYPPRLAGRPC